MQEYIRELSEGLGCVHKYNYFSEYSKGCKGILGIFIFDSWLYSNKLTEDATDFGADMNGMVKTNKTIFSIRPLRRLQSIVREILILC